MSIDDLYELDVTALENPELVAAVRLTLNREICAYRDVSGKRHGLSEDYRGRPAQIYLSQVCKFAPGPQFARDYHIKAYAGGRTEVFAYRDVSNALKLDVNSMYPYVFARYPMYDPTSAIEGANLDYDGWTFAKVVQPDFEYPVLPWTLHSPKGDENTVYPIGEFQGVWSNRELLYAKETCNLHIREVLGGVHYTRSKNTNIINSVIARLYKAKADAQTLPERKAAKAVLNSGIGYYDRRPYHYWAVRREMSNMYPPDGVMVSKVRCTQGREWLIFKCPSRDGDKRNGIFRHVAACARIELHKALMQLHENDNSLLYCDTDCIAFEGDNNPLPIGDDLGQWKIESKGRFRAYGRKRYVAGEKAVVAGFSCLPRDISEYGYYSPKPGVIIRLKELVPSREDLDDDFEQTQPWERYRFQGLMLSVYGQAR